MNARVEYLRRRRESLVAQAAAQRSEVYSIALQLQKRMRPVDTAFAIVQAMRKHPVMTAVSAILLLPPPRNKLLRWSSRLFTFWELFCLVRKQWHVVR